MKLLLVIYSYILIGCAGYTQSSPLIKYLEGSTTAFQFFFFFFETVILCFDTVFGRNIKNEFSQEETP